MKNFIVFKNYKLDTFSGTIQVHFSSRKYYIYFYKTSFESIYNCSNYPRTEQIQECLMTSLFFGNLLFIHVSSYVCICSAQNCNYGSRQLRKAVKT